MATTDIGIVIDWNQSPEGWKDQHKESHIAGVRQLGVAWHQQILKKHFELGAASRYDYQKRTAKYMIRKGKRRHHQKPLIFTGDLRRAMLAMKPAMSGTANIFKMRFTGLPRYAYMTPTNHPSKARELVRVTDSENAELMEVYQDIYRREMEKRGYKFEG